jgi:hypothetical protein
MMKRIFRLCFFQLFSLIQSLATQFYRLADLIELRKLRKARQGIDVAKLNKGDIKKKRKRPREEGEQSGLRKGTLEEEECVSLSYIPEVR